MSRNKHNSNRNLNKKRNTNRNKKKGDLPMKTSNMRLHHIIKRITFEYNSSEDRLLHQRKMLYKNYTVVNTYATYDTSTQSNKYIAEYSYPLVINDKFKSFLTTNHMTIRLVSLIMEKTYVYDSYNLLSIHKREMIKRGWVTNYASTLTDDLAIVYSSQLICEEECYRANLKNEALGRKKQYAKL